MKKTLVAILCLLSLSFTFLGNGIVAHAQEIDEKSNDVFVSEEETNAELVVMSDAEVADSLASIEQELSNNGTDVIAELGVIFPVYTIL